MLSNFVNNICKQDNLVSQLAMSQSKFSDTVRNVYFCTKYIQLEKTRFSE